MSPDEWFQRFMDATGAEAVDPDDDEAVAVFTRRFLIWLENTQPEAYAEVSEAFLVTAVATLVEERLVALEIEGKARRNDDGTWQLVDGAS